MMMIIGATLGFVVFATAVLIVQIGFILTLCVVIVAMALVIGAVVGFISLARFLAHRPQRGGFG